MKRFKLVLTILACSAVLQSASAINLPFEVEETLLQLMGIKDMSKINKGSIVPIYRKDLDPNYIAYYEINHRNKSIVLSAGPKTKDYPIAESGPIPTPTQVLVNQAAKVKQRCHKFFRLTSMGLYMCENRKGFAVAATFDWIADAPDKHVKDWKKLQKMVQESLKYFKKSWQDVAKSAKDERETTRRKKANKKPGTRAFDAEIVSPGSTGKVALEKHHRNISIHAIPEKRQKELCAILVDVCKGNDIKVNPKRIHKTKNRFRYLRFQVNEDKKMVRKLLRNKEISFYFKIETSGGEQLLKYFSVDLSSHRKRRWTPWSRWSIRSESLFPDYNQHRCCGCYSGSGAVAWAQILGYYDRLAHYTSSSGFSGRFWTCSDGYYTNTCVAPSRTSHDVRRYIVGVRSKLGTFCSFGGGATTPSQMKRIVNWYRARGIGGRIHSQYHRVTGRTSKKITNTAANHVKAGYPAILGIWVKTSTHSKVMHYAVATRYAVRSRQYRSCFLFLCKTKTALDKRYYLHMGLGGRSNGWYKVPGAYATFCARKH